ncbi:MAG: metallophosphoesterase [Pseudomonadota bacterium]
MLSRRDLLRLLLAAPVALAGYAGAVEPGWRLRVQRWAIQPPLWPRGRRLRIVALADPHIAPPHMPLSRFERIVTRANALSPDLIVLLGDYPAGHRFTFGPVAPERIAEAMAKLSAPLGVFAILGNHDWWEDPQAQARGAGPTLWHGALHKAGIRLLENSAVAIGHGAQRFWLAGIGDPIAFLPSRDRHPRRGVDDHARMVAEISDDAPAILLLHEPDFWPDWRDRFAVSLAGHTHGGQVRLFGWSPLVPSMYGTRFAWGPVEEDRRVLVVSGGLGCSILPVRLGMPPEITLVELS